LVPRKRGCWVCEHVATPEDVTVRLFSEDGTRRQGRGATSDAAQYIRGILGKGNVSSETLSKRLANHASHVELAMQGGPAAPGALVPLEPEGPAYWLDVNQNAVNVGNAALGVIATRMPDMEDKELVAVAKLGVTAAQKVGDWEAKGRKMAQIGDLIRLASGMEIEGESREIAP
jgi:hypothetical protein